MLVNPEILRAFAGHVDAASEKTGAAHVGQVVSTSADGLPGSTAQWAARLVAATLAAKEAEIARNVAGMGAAVRGAGDRYEVQDDELAGKFKGLFR
jgi:hypothetical protein